MTHFSTSHFGAKAIKALAKKGITITGMQALPDQTGSFLNSETGYILNDNGTAKVRTYLQVRELAK